MQVSYTVLVSNDKKSIRLDRFLAEALPKLSRHRLKILIKHGQVLIGGIARYDPAYKVRAGEIYVVNVPKDEPAKPEPQALTLDIIYEDDHLIVINKPAGMVVHPAAGNSSHTLVNALLAHCGNSLSGIGGIKRPGIVHRLDKDTSGLIVAAKSDLAHHGLAEQFAAHSLARAYKALVWGVPIPYVGEIKGNIGRSTRNRKKMSVLKQGGKPALTHYRVLHAVGSFASLIECQLATGRTHQIRVHMAHVGHAIVGDPVYGRLPRRLPHSVIVPLTHLKRQALHATVIGFYHPKTGKFLRFEQKIPDDIKKMIDTLECI